MNKQNIQTPLLTSSKSQEEELIANFDDSSFCSQLFFSWLSKVVSLGNKKCLEQSDLNVKINRDQLEKDKQRFKQYMEKYRNKKHMLVRILLNQFMQPFLLGYLLSFIGTILQFSTPIMISYVLKYLQKPDREVQEGLIYLVLSVGIRIVSQILDIHSQFQLNMLGIRMCNLLNLIVFDKTLAYSIIQSNKFEIGKLVNLIQVDTEKLIDSSFFITFILNFPIQIAILVIFLFHEIGFNFLISFGVLVVILAINLVCGIFINQFQSKQLNWKDKRMKSIDEFINGIKTIKLNQWYDLFIKRIEVIRNKELRYTNLGCLFLSIIITSAYLTMPLIQGVTLTFYSLVGHHLQLDQVMSMLASFKLIVGPLIAVPYGIGFLLQAYTSLKRIEQFLKEPDIDLVHIDYQANHQQYALQIHNGNFHYATDQQNQQDQQISANKKTKKKKTKKENIVSQNISLQIQNDEDNSKIENKGDQDEKKDVSVSFMLQNLDIKVKKGQLVAIIGKIGSGKTSILQSLSGEVKAIDQQTKVEISGKISYVPQKSWSISGTIEKNIQLFHEDDDKERVNQCIIDSSMQKDLELLNKKIHTEIGNNGINLSGGQKARLNIARAIYQENDIILMDDPLSALDLHVGEYIMQHTILKRLKGKTIIMVTHALNYLKYFDYIYFMEDGKVSIQGDYQTVSQDEKVQELIKKYKNSVEQLKNQFETNLETEQQSQVQQVNERKVSQCSNNQEQKQENLIIDEQRKRGAIQFSLYWHFFAKGMGLGPIFIAILSVFITNLLTYSLDFFIVYWFEDKFNKSESFYISWYFIITFVIALSVFIRVTTLCTQQVNLGRKIHSEILQRLSLASINDFFERVPTGRILNRLSKDINVIDSNIGLNFGGLSINFVRCIYSLVLFFTLTNYISLVIIFGFLFLSLTLSKYYLKSYREVIRLESISKSPICVFYKETCDGLTSIRTYNKQQPFYTNFLKLLELNKDNKYVEYSLMKWFQMRLCLLSFLLNIFNTSYILFFFEKEYALAGILFQYSQNLDNDFRIAVNQFIFFESKFVSYERTIQYTEIDEEKGFDEESKKRYQQYQEQQGNSLESWPNSGKLEFQNVSTRYRENLPLVLKGLNFSIESGQKVGIVGRTGAGKSTLINLFFRILEPEEGRLLVDEQDIRNIELNRVRSVFSLISQDPYLFQGNLQTNLDPQSKYDKEYLNGLIDRLEIQSDLGMKLDDVIDKEGGNLSAGQKQLICILRAIVCKSRIILIDEATANIDVKTEKQIQKMISEEFKDCTILTIAHRINTLQNSDMILVINKGRIEEYGKPHELLNNCNSFFKKLCDQLEANVNSID